MTMTLRDTPGNSLGAKPWSASESESDADSASSGHSAWSLHPRQETVVTQQAPAQASHALRPSASSTVCYVYTCLQAHTPVHMHAGMSLMLCLKIFQHHLDLSYGNVVSSDEVTLLSH